MKITLNGKSHEVDGVSDVVALLKSLNVKAEQVAVAINGNVVPRRDWAKTNVSPGDSVEVVRAVGGGSR